MGVLLVFFFILPKHSHSNCTINTGLFTSTEGMILKAVGPGNAAPERILARCGNKFNYLPDRTPRRSCFMESFISSGEMEFTFQFPVVWRENEERFVLAAALRERNCGVGWVDGMTDGARDTRLARWSILMVLGETLVYRQHARVTVSLNINGRRKKTKEK